MGMCKKMHHMYFMQICLKMIPFNKVVYIVHILLSVGEIYKNCKNMSIFIKDNEVVERILNHTEHFPIVKYFR